MSDLASPQIAIIGAGLAGLTAAYRLKQAGFHAKVYEARERLGGRVLTIALGASYAELGGQALEDGGDAKTIRNLIQELGFSLEKGSQRPIHNNIVFGNQIDDIFQLTLELPTAEQGLNEQLKALEKKAANMDQLLDLFCAGRNPSLRPCLGRMMRSYEGSDPVNLSPIYHSSLSLLLQRYQMWAIQKSKGEVPRLSLSHVKGGNSRLIEALAEGLQGQIQTNIPLEKISRKSDGRLLLHFAEGKKVSVDCAVLALPCSALKNVELEEGIFPDDQIKAIHTLQYGSNAKIILPVQFAAPPIPAVLSTENFFSWFNHDDTLMVLYYGGTPGIFCHKSAADIRMKLQPEFASIKLVYGSQASFPETPAPVGMSWYHEEYSKGSYSNLAPGTEQFFQKEAVIGGERIKSVFRPIDNQIFFAGEHTSVDVPASLEGAVDSGEKASRMILKAFSSFHH